LAALLMSVRARGFDLNSMKKFGDAIDRIRAKMPSAIKWNKPVSS
jgi:hypothetical protein